MEKSLYILILSVFLTLQVVLGGVNEISNNALEYYIKNYGHENPDVLMIAQADLFNNGSTQVLFSFEKGDYYGNNGRIWNIFNYKDNTLINLKMLDCGGKTNDFGSADFYPDKACFVYLPTYKSRGILAMNRGLSFTYFINSNTITTELFKNPSELGFTEEEIRKLFDSNKIKIIKKSVREVGTNSVFY